MAAAGAARPLAAGERRPAPPALERRPAPFPVIWRGLEIARQRRLHLLHHRHSHGISLGTTAMPCPLFDFFF
uniref:Uncharacterized protein n=1 Tax=Setaria viridis TaxID=4556 RepID=A0A4U6TED2_SETVI|nr:hypothetical protein SEVIR_8G116780v2 [Setaria viridis]